MKILSVLLLLVFLLGVLSTAQAQFEQDDLLVDEQQDQQDQQQQGEGEGEPQQISMTREALEGFLQALSGECRTEMEAAMASNSGDVSPDCRQEIQRALISLNLVPGHTQAQGQAQGQEDGEAEGESSGRRKTRRQRRAADNSNADNSDADNDNNSEGSSRVLFAIFAFVAALFGGAALFVAAKSKSGSSDGANKPAKKLSKKKEEKLRMKNQAR